MARRPRSSTIASMRSVPSTHEILPLKVGDSIKLRVAVHDNPQTGPATSHILLNREYWPGVAPEDVIRIDWADAAEPCYFTVQVDDPLPAPHIQVTIARDVSELFKLPSGTEVELSKVEPDARVSADYIEIFFRDQYLGRPDMWRLSSSLAGQCLHVEQRVRFVGAIEAVIKSLYRRGKLVKSALISADTKIIYHSLTANCTIFIQVCQELWDFAEDGERYNEKIVHSFLPALFDHWKRLGTNHVVTIVLMSRVYYEPGEAVYAAGPIQRDEDNQQYKDFFKVETDLEVVADWKPILDGLKESFFAFQRDILLTHHYHTAVRDGNNSIPRLVGRISYAHDGPLLEALNLALQPTETHYIDRSLALTGVATIVITPGRGYYRVSKALLRLTTTRLLDQGFGVSIVCLGRSPLHATPLFSFYGKDPAKAYKENKSGSQSGREYDVLWGGEAVVIMDDKEQPCPPPDRTVIYWQPFWVTLMYWDLQRDLPFRKDKYIARARMPEFEMLGLLHYDLVSSIAIPPLQDYSDENKEPPESPDSVSSSRNTQESEKTEEYRRQFDQDTFTCASRIPASPLSAHAMVMRSDSVHASPLVSGRQRGSLMRRSSSSTSISTKYDNGMPATESSLAGRRSRPTSAHFDDDIRNRLTSFAPSTSPKDQRLTRLTRPEHRHHKSLLATTEPSPSHRESTISQTQPHSHSRRGSSAALSNGPSRSRHNSSAVSPLPSPLVIEAIPEIPDNTSINSTDTTKSGEKRSSVLQFPLMRLASSIFLTRFRSVAGYPPTETVSPSGAAAASKSGNSELRKQNLPVSSPQRPQPLPITHAPPQRVHKSHEAESNPAPGQRNSFTRGSPLSNSPLVNTNPPTPSLVMSHRSPILVTSLPPLANPAFREHPILYNQTSLARRWEHLSPTPTYETQIKWKSLCAPGCLPLTVEHIPTEEELAKGFRVHSYETTIGSEMNESFLVKRPVFVRGQAPEEAWGMAIMRVMVALRLAQGFQFVLQNSRIVHQPPQDMSLSSTVTAKPLLVLSRKPRGPAEILREADIPVYLSMSDQIHKIQYDPSGPSIRVERFVRRMPASVPIPYKCLIWPKLGGGYTECHTLFTSQDMALYGWNRLDMLAFGYEQNLTDSLRYWRTRFLVIPSDKRPEPRSATRGGRLLTEEETRLCGMVELAARFTAARWLRQDENPDSHAPVKFVMTTLDPVSSVLDDQLMAKLDEAHHAGSLRKKPNSNRVLTEMSLDAIALAMRMPDGIIRDNRWHNAYYPDSFTGEEFVSWLLREFRDISTREQGADQGSKLEAQGLFGHCRGHHGFIDGHYFYTLNPPYASGPVPAGPQQGPKRWRYLRTSHEEKHPPPLPTANPANQPAETSAASRKRRILSQSFIVNLDPQGKSNQSETAVLHHDIIQNPETAFHFQLHWIGASAKFVDDTIQSWSRTVERYGLRMVEAYVDQIADINKSNFFQSYYPIRLAVPPPVLPEETNPPPEYCVSALLRRFDFIPDIMASRHYPASVDVFYSYRSTAFDHSQWVHRSGLVFIQVLEDGVTLAWLNNRLASTRQVASTDRLRERPATRADHLCGKLENLCTNPVALNVFWKETREAWMEKFASEQALHTLEVEEIMS